MQHPEWNFSKLAHIVDLLKERQLKTRIRLQLNRVTHPTQPFDLLFEASHVTCVLCVVVCLSSVRGSVSCLESQCLHHKLSSIQKVAQTTASCSLVDIGRSFRAGDRPDD